MYIQKCTCKSTDKSTDHPIHLWIPLSILASAVVTVHMAMIAISLRFHYRQMASSVIRAIRLHASLMEA